MGAAGGKGNHHLRFDVSDRPPNGLSALLALQTVMLSGITTLLQARKV